MDRKETAVEVKGLRKSFGGQRVLGGIDLKVPYGETLAVLGRSGTGKSVLLKLLVGLQTPDSGSIAIDGQEIIGLSSNKLNEVRKAIGFLFQYAALYDSLTVGANVEFPLKRHRKEMSASKRKERAGELLEQVGMEDHARKMPAQISGGMKKRVGLARALALEPKILLFDEPTSGLDPITSAEIDELILQVQKRYKTASIVVTHDLHSARTISDRLALVHEGRILMEGSFDDLNQSRDEFVLRFLGRAA
jgi:phospholipid/cholesterol/gamma-HCH transport system ATP-binding protein